MNKLKNVSLKTKLIIMTAMLSILSITVAGFYSYDTAKSSLLDEEFNKLDAVKIIKKNQIEAYFNTKRKDIETLSELPSIRKALRDYTEAYKKGINSVEYKESEKKWNGILSTYTKKHNYYDLFLIDKNGNVVYTVCREPDYATNLINGPYASTGLGIAFKEALNGKFKITDIEHYAPSNDAPAMFMAVPVYDDGELIGVLALQIPLDEISKIMNERTGLGDTGETYLVGKDLLMRSDSRFSNEPTTLKLKVDTETAKLAIEGKEGHKIITDYRGVPVLSSYAPVTICGQIKWGILSEIDLAEAMAPVDDLRNNIIIGLIVLALLSSAAAYYILEHLIIRYLRELENILDELIKGNLEIEPKIKFNNDEIGRLYDKVSTLVENLQEEAKRQLEDKKALAQTFKELTMTMQKVAEGDLTVRMDESGKQNKLQKTINMMIDNMSNLINELKAQIIDLNKEIKTLREEIERAKETSDQVTDAASQVATAATDQANKLQDISQDLEGTGEAAEKVYNAAIDAVNSANEIEENSETGVNKVENAIDTMQRITNVIDDLGRAIQELGDESKKINEVTVLIKDIAEQTGLLALNASIEAARAGEAGKGFAVVASEIKSLAEEIGKSVDDIAKTITGIQGKVEKTIDLGLTGKDEVDKGVIAIDEVNNAFMKIRESVDKAIVKINAIKEDSKRASENVQQALRNVQDIASISEEFAATAEELTASAEEQNRIMDEISKATDKIADVSDRVSESASKFKV
jgi:methyl-accepting chemotaxis protein